jgi:hypothetical protein
MLLLPRELWDQVSVESLKNDVLQVLKGRVMGRTFQDLTNAHKYDKESKLYCVRRFISLYLHDIVVQCHIEDYNFEWETPWGFFMRRHVTSFRNPVALMLLQQFMHSIHLGEYKRYFQSVWDQATDEWVSTMPKEHCMMTRMHNLFFLDTLERRLALFPQYINWINPWSLWISEDIHVPMEKVSCFTQWLVYHQVFPQEEYYVSDSSSDSLVGIEDLS